jgi:hypothetical protein
MSSNRNEWKPKGRAGKFHVWHAGKNIYYVTEGKDGEVIGEREFYGSAFSLASHYERLSTYSSGVTA